jgi:hypothetical protein
LLHFYQRGRLLRSRGFCQSVPASYPPPPHRAAPIGCSIFATQSSCKLRRRRCGLKPRRSVAVQRRNSGIRTRRSGRAQEAKAGGWMHVEFGPVRPAGLFSGELRPKPSSRRERWHMSNLPQEEARNSSHSQGSDNQNGRPFNHDCCHGAQQPAQTERAPHSICGAKFETAPLRVRVGNQGRFRYVNATVPSRFL